MIFRTFITLLQKKTVRYFISKVFKTLINFSANDDSINEIIAKEIYVFLQQ